MDKALTPPNGFASAWRGVDDGHSSRTGGAQPGDVQADGSAPHARPHTAPGPVPHAGSTGFRSSHAQSQALAGAQALARAQAQAQGQDRSGTEDRSQAEDHRPRPVGVEATGAFLAAALLWVLQLLPPALIEMAMGGAGDEGVLTSLHHFLDAMMFFQSPVWVIAPAAVTVALFAVRQLRPRPVEGQLFLLPVLAIVVYGVAGEIPLNVLEPGTSLGGPFFIMMTTLFGAPIMVLLVAIAYTMWSTAPQRARRVRRLTVR